MKSEQHDEECVGANLKQRSRRNRKKKKQPAQESAEIVDQKVEIVKIVQKASKETTQQPPEELKTAVTEINAQENYSPTEVKNSKKRRKRRKNKKKVEFVEENDSGIENLTHIDYSGPHGQLFLSADNLFNRLSEEIPTLQKAIQSLESSKEKEIDHLMRHLEIAQNTIIRLRGPPLEAYLYGLNAWYNFMLMLAYYISYYGNRNSKEHKKEIKAFAKERIGDLLQMKVLFEEAQLNQNRETGLEPAHDTFEENKCLKQKGFLPKKALKFTRNSSHGNCQRRKCIRRDGNGPTDQSLLPPPGRYVTGEVLHVTTSDR